MPTTGSRSLDCAATASDGPSRGEVCRLTFLFGTLAFLQGLNEPTEGLLAQPVRSLLRSRGKSISEITGFVAVMALPWLLKPLYGVISDFVPLAGSRRRSYLVLSGAVTALALLILFAFPSIAGANAGLLGWLALATAAVAFADVVTDALMVDQGRPRGLTGRFQAVQWACMYAAGFASGLVGGELCERQAERVSFLVCGLAALLSLAVVVAFVRDSDDGAEPTGRGETLRQLLGAARSRMVPAIAAFLLLWNFNPFTNAVLHHHLTAGMGFGERFYGRTLSLTSVASIAASVAYGFYCRRVPMIVLAHASIVLGVASTLAYLLVVDEGSAVVVTLLVGFIYMTATLIQLDLAARHCPPGVAGTVFASLMALTNLSASLSVWAGGMIYERGVVLWDSRTAFRVLILISAATTASCWLLVPLLPRGILRSGNGGRE